MVLNLDEIAITYPEQLILAIAPEQINFAWSQMAKYVNFPAQRNMVINHLCMDVISQWLQTEVINQPIDQFPIINHADALWSVVNGCKVSIDNLSMVFIPTEEIDTAVFAIPQEWLRIPLWIAQYYVAVMIDMEEGWLRIYGYTEFETIEKKANYNTDDGYYYLDREWLTEDINIMWVVNQLNPSSIIELKSLPSLTNDRAISLITELAQPDIYLPRLQINFTEWGALLVHDNLLQLLHEKRCQNIDKDVVNLRQWFDHIFPVAWQSIDQIFDLTPQEIVWGLRAEIPITRGRVLDLGMTLGEEKVALIVFLRVENTQEIDLIILLYPVGEKCFLPAGLQLAAIDEQGVLCEEIVARENDKLIQLKLGAEFGERFSIHVTLGDVQITQNFSV